MTDDIHVRRSGADYGQAFANLLPFGIAWPREAQSVLMRAVKGLAECWGIDGQIKNKNDPSAPIRVHGVDARAADLLEQESDPRITYELLPDWERNWGLPDPCYKAPQTYDARIKELIRRMTILGAQSREFFIGVAEEIGYKIAITEYRTFVVGIDRVGDARVYGSAGAPDPFMRNEWGNPIMDAEGDAYVKEGELSEYPYYGLGPDTNRFYWTVHVEEVELIWFRCGSNQCGVDPHLRIRLADELECLLNRWKPAHTEIIFDYSGMDPPLIQLSAYMVREDAATGTTIGTFSLTGFFSGMPVYALVDNAGGRFDISDNNLVAVSGLDYEVAASHNITVEVSGIDQLGAIESFIITVIDVIETLELTLGAPVLGVPVLAQRQMLSARELVPWPPVFGTPMVIKTFATLDGAVANVTLTNGNLTATHSSTASNSGARSTMLKNSGKWYFEVTITDFDGAADSIGLLTSAGTFTNFVTNSTNCMVVHRATGAIWSNNANSGKVLGVISDGAVMQWAVDLNTNEFWVRVGTANWNGDGAADPSTGMGGLSCGTFSGTTLAPAVGFGGTGSQTGDNVTFNFGRAAFVHPVPTGFTAGWASDI